MDNLFNAVLVGIVAGVVAYVAALAVNMIFSKTVLNEKNTALIVGVLIFVLSLIS